VAGSSTNSSGPAGLLIELDHEGGPALHRQIEAGLRQAIRAGRLNRDDALPPSRALAADLGVSRGVVVEAYAQLVAEGYLTSRSGGYTRVAATAGADPRAAPAPALRAPPAVPPTPPAVVDFGYGRADVSTFPRAAWLRAIRRVFAQTPGDRLGYLDGHGVLELRSALADYLNRVRGTVASAENVVITTGYGQGIRLVIEVLAARGARRLAIEDPSADDDARPAAEAHGLEVVGVPVDRGGVRVDALAGLDADALILTPSHQWPTGGVLSAEARAAVIRWAAATGATVIEDDYDAEYRYDRAPIGAIQGLAPDHVVYAGTASKTLAAGLRLGWFVLPPHLVAGMAAAKLQADRGSPVIDQLTLADFMARGDFDRHLRRMRPIYRRRRDALLAALARHLPDVEPAGIAAGLHLVAWLPPGLDEAAVVEAARANGVAIAGVSPYRLTAAPADAVGGLIFGYGTLDAPAIEGGVERLAAAIAALRAR
jgi:GntR family transcriptional regulator/MocR family aminotransferase